MPVARDGAHRIAEQRQVHNLGQRYERLNVVPVAYVVAVQVEELELGQAREHLGRRQRRDRIVRQIELLQVRKALQEHEVALLQEVTLQVCDG